MYEKWNQMKLEMAHNFQTKWSDNLTEAARLTSIILQFTILF